MNLHDRVHSDTISKEIEGSITKIAQIHQNEYEWEDYVSHIRSDVSTIIYILLKIINTATKIGVSNPKYETKKANVYNL